MRQTDEAHVPSRWTMETPTEDEGTQCVRKITACVIGEARVIRDYMCGIRSLRWRGRFSENNE